ncbi:MAG TPA: MFS transporter [Alphaproteobacteria bacterium]|nr:MFS transporter [Alphaproteobacteria bacterium]
MDRRNGILAAAILGSSMVFIDSTVVNVILPRLQSEFHVTGVQIQWVVDAYLLFLSALILLGGALGDHLGRRVVFEAGIVVFAVASVGCGLSRTLWQLTLARCVQGIGGALLTPGSLAIIDASFPGTERGKAIGTWAGFTAITTALGPVLGGWLSDNLSWRWVFFINMPLAIITLTMTREFVPVLRLKAGGPALDIKGAIASTLGLGGITLGLVESARTGIHSAYVWMALLGGLVLVLLFLRIESASAAPMLPLRLFNSKVFSVANTLTLLLYGSLGAILYFLPFNLIQVQGFTATQTGAANLPFVLIMFLLSRWSGRLYDRFGARLPLTIGPLLAACGFLLLGYLPGIHSRYWTRFFPGIAVIAIGMTICVPALTTAVLSSAPAARSGVVSGVNNAVARLGTLLAVAVMTLFVFFSYERFLQAALGHLALNPEIKGQLIAQSRSLAGPKIPSADPRVKFILKQAVAESYLKSFRDVTLLAAMLTVAGAFIALTGLKGVCGEPGEKCFQKQVRQWHC